MRKLAAAALLVIVSACAAKIIPAPVVTTPKYPEFLLPAVPPSYASTAAAISHDRAWRFLQAGDLKNAEREFNDALKATPAFYPAEVGLGDVELARKDPKAALPHFDRVLAAHDTDVPALVGRGQALSALGRDADALAAFEAAVAADPSLADIRRRVEVMRFRGLERDLSRARQAARDNKLEDATAAYERAIATSPDSGVLYRELGAVERRKGDSGRALEHFRRAVELDPSDAASWIAIGDLLDAGGDLAGAEQAYTSAVAVQPDAAVDAKLDAVRARMELSRLPEEYRAIDQAPQITRADLAALIGVRLAPLLQDARRNDAVLITDVRSSWAAPWIVAVARAGVMEPFSNHAFQPRATIRRADLAQAVSRLLARIAAARPAQSRQWVAARLKFTDLSAGHVAYVAVSQAVAAGVMEVGPDNAFQPSRPVTGAEAIAAIDRLEALARDLPFWKGAVVR